MERSDFSLKRVLSQPQYRFSSVIRTHLQNQKLNKHMQKNPYKLLSFTIVFKVQVITLAYLENARLVSLQECFHLVHLLPQTCSVC